MIVACHQPNFLPWSGFFYKALRADCFILLDDVQFPRNGRWCNRNRIKCDQGELWLTVPVRKKHRGLQKIKNVEICYERSWTRKHVESIQQHYCHSPYFEQHIYFCKDFYSRPWKLLVDLNVAMIHYLGESLGIAKKFVRQSPLRVEGSGSELLVALCRAVGADTYLAEITSKKFLDEALFYSAGINLSFFRFKSLTYPQLWGDPIANLSFIDLLFNCGDRSREILVRHNPLHVSRN